MSVTISDAVTGEFDFADESYVDDFAKKFAYDLPRPLVIWLQGDLGAGKTTFARGLIHALGYAGRVKSPTYGLLEHYQLESLQVLHMDLYRISDPGELEFLGVEDLLDEQTILLIEWPEKGGLWLPRPDFIFRFDYADKGRVLHLVACTPSARAFYNERLNT
ncbi:MAG: tRNA (adenosine(37)-N6)-threonylcarbamoyltransferase complex ATPase subunit type 1 TsaE [Lysobacterales bacterium]